MLLHPPSLVKESIFANHTSITYGYVPELNPFQKHLLPLRLRTVCYLGETIGSRIK